MALTSCKHFRSILISFNNAGWNQLAVLYSQFAPTFRPPIFNKEKVESAVKTFTVEEINALRVKPPLSDQTCSIFYDPDVVKLINYISREGKKEIARTQVEKAFEHIKHIQLRKYNSEKNEELKSQIELSPVKLLHQAIANATPQLIVKKLKKSGTWYNVPTSVTPKYAKFIAMRWLVEVSKNKDPTFRFYKSLGDEIIASSQSEGKATKKKLELHKLCEANRSYAHYKWA